MFLHWKLARGSTSTSLNCQVVRNLRAITTTSTKRKGAHTAAVQQKHRTRYQKWKRTSFSAQHSSRKKKRFLTATKQATHRSSRAMISSLPFIARRRFRARSSRQSPPLLPSSGSGPILTFSNRPRHRDRRALRWAWISLA